MILAYIGLLLGFVLLIRGASFFVDGSSKIAKLLKVSPLLIGLTIVAFGTSSPEATVSILAALRGNADVAMGNVVGSNILNITLVVGITALIYPLTVANETIKKEIPFTLLGSFALLILISDYLFQPALGSNTLSRGDGLILLLFFMIFLYYIFEIVKSNRQTTKLEAPVSDAGTWGKNILFTILGLAFIIIGGDLVVRNSSTIAIALGMSQTLVGLTIVSIGTSLPELVTSIVAALRKERDIALGNIVGSNIFNIFFVLGAAAVINPLFIDSRIILDLILLIMLTFMLLIFSRTRYTIGKKEGACLAVAYVVYFIYIIIRN